MVTADSPLMSLVLKARADRPWLGELFDRQLGVALARSRFRAVTCSRRAGKTVLLAALAADGLEACGHDEAVVYVARTRAIAKDLMWSKIKRLAAQYRPQWTMREAELRIDTPNGGALLIRGAEGASPGEELDKLRGLKMRRALVDEPATYAETLSALLRDAIEPALGDLRGDVVVAGTPGIVCAGPWHEISTGVRKKWTRYGWTIVENPHFADAVPYLRDVRDENHWSEDHPTYRREYLGQWVVDDSAQVYRYLASRNLRPMPLDYDRERWVHTLGVDFGMSDETAWVVLASHPHRREVWMVHADKQGGLLPDEAAERTKRLYDLYRPDRIVGDAGGLGKPYVEAHNRRFPGAPMRPADKTEKRAHIELLNGDLMSGRFLAAEGGVCQPWVAEVQVLPWADERRLDEHKAYANHCADAALYAYRAHLSYLHEAPKPIAPTRRKVDDPALEDEEAQRFAEAARRPWWAEDEF